MAKTLIDRIQASLAKEGLTPRTNAARKWLRAKIDELSPSPQNLMRDRERLRENSMVGRMYFYFYNPKLRFVAILRQVSIGYSNRPILRRFSRTEFALYQPKATNHSFG